MDFILQPEQKVRICDTVDVCVVGGGCTGVFAAVRAARLGLRVAIIEKSNGFGGMAAGGLVCIWHGIHDADGKNQIIAGLTHEVLERLIRRNAVAVDIANTNRAYTFSPVELKAEMDLLVRENRITPYLHTFYAGIAMDGDQVEAVYIQNKDGRSAIKAKFFIDATGDGDIARDAGIERTASGATLQPPTYCFLMQGDLNGVDVNSVFAQHRQEFGLEDDWGWSAAMPGMADISMRADNHIFNVNCAIAGDLTSAEIEGRRKLRAFIDMMKMYGNPGASYAAVADCAMMGVRETYHYKTKYRATEADLLNGKRFPDAVLNGTYRVDIHHSEDAGITFRYLDGTQHIIYGRNERHVRSRWRDETCDYPRFYQAPFSILVNDIVRNLIPVGRMINADEGAFGALRVMVNLNQLGEAAGVAAYLALHQGKSIQALDGFAVASALRTGGSA